MYRYRLERIRFNEGTEIEPGSLTVVVGPNNSGKSRFLKDVKDFCTSQYLAPVVLSEVEHSVPVKAQDLTDAYGIKLELISNQSALGFSTLNADMTGIHNVSLLQPDSISDRGAWFQSTVENMIGNWEGETNKRQFANYFGSYFVNRLTTESRLTITSRGSQQTGHVDSPLVRAFYEDGSEVERNVDEIIHKAFPPLHVKLDYTDRAYLAIRVSDKSFADVPADPRDAREPLSRARLLDEEGDGVRSFCATVLSLLVNSRPVLLLDAPEAFLHPPQALHLGETIANLSSENRQIIIATHSVDLLRGILNETTDVDVIRLSREAETTVVKRLTVDKVQAIATNPLLSSTRVLDGLFYKGVVVVEADADSAFYQRVARSLRSGDEIHYVHAHNKQTLHKVVRPYREMGVPTVAVADFDLLRNEDDFANLMSATTDVDLTEILRKRQILQDYIESQPRSSKLEDLQRGLNNLIGDLDSGTGEKTESEALADIRRRLKKMREESGEWYEYKLSGEEVLDEEHRVVFQEINEFCKEHGLFVVHVGELESWLRDYGLEPSSNKNTWIVKALQKIAEVDLTGSTIEKFVTEIHEYLSPSEDGCLLPE